jgi:Uma2 family endonuclease
MKRMAHSLASEVLLTVEEFLGFTDTRPDGERWELIEGVAILNPSPTDFHQVVVMNIATALSLEKQRLAAGWLPLLGIGTRVPASPNSLPQPDVVVKAAPVADRAVTEDALVVFEVLSKSNTKGDQLWRRKVYASVPNCAHYVTVSLKTVEVIAYDRNSSWQPRQLGGFDAGLELPEIGATLRLADIYRWTPLASV